MRSLSAALRLSRKPLMLLTAKSVRSRIPIVLMACLLPFMFDSSARGQASFSSSQLRPFVIGLIPVVGPNGAVGGVMIDSEGVIARAELDDTNQLRDVQRRALERIRQELYATSELRKVSLKRLQQQIVSAQREERSLTQEVLFLAGLQRIDYVFVYPDENDIVIAGPAEPWTVNDLGDVVGMESGLPVLQLDDLMAALRSPGSRLAGNAISCTIDPTDDGLARLQRFLRRRDLQPHQDTLSAAESILGPQDVRITGIEPESHFARVMVASDFLMKRIAMGFEPSGIRALPSFLAMMARQARRLPRNAAPRWWMALDVESISRDPSGAAWQFDELTIEVLTQEGYLDAQGRVVDSSQEDPIARSWAERMTENYDALSEQMTVFAKLRNCMNMAMLATLIAREDLIAPADCDLSLLTDPEQTQFATYPAPAQVPSHASLLRAGRGWLISVSGGVSMDTFAEFEEVAVDEGLADLLASERPPEEGWWWD